jgi:hypothetical protein
VVKFRYHFDRCGSGRTACWVCICVL